MFNFENQICGVCGKAFDKDSDIVVCPECGTPHHRECWHEIGHCVNRDKHDTGFEWRPEAKEVPAGSITCPECGSIMPAGTLFCEHCGKALNRPQAYPMNPYGAANDNSYNKTQMPGGEAFARFVETEFVGEIDGFPTKEVAAFIGPNSLSYVRKFKKLCENKKTPTFNFFAFMFTPLWFLYWKMWPVAIATAILNFLTGLPVMILTGVQAGIISSASPLVFSGIETVAVALSVVQIIIGFVFGFLAIPMLKKDTIRRMTKIKEESGGDRQLYYKKLIEKSGPSKIGAFVIVLFVAYSIFTLFMP